MKLVRYLLEALLVGCLLIASIWVTFAGCLLAWHGLVIEDPGLKSWGDGMIGSFAMALGFEMVRTIFRDHWPALRQGPQ